MSSESRAATKMFAHCSFLDLGLHQILCDQLKERLGFGAPTAVQAEVIPVVLSGRHVLVNAPTGTGKTVAYLAPIIHLLQGFDQRIQRSDGTLALVLVPTRELCMQVYEILQKLLHRFHWIVPGYIMGGENRAKEKSRLRKGISILVATPGRLLDHLKNTSSFIHSKLRWVIFDEADSILELGYGKDIEEILNFLQSGQHRPASAGNLSAFEVQRQHLLLSATLNDRVNHLARISLENPVMIGLEGKKTTGYLSSHECDVLDVVENDGKMSSSSLEEYSIPSQLMQTFIKVPCSARLAVLLSILRHLFEREVTQKIVVFFSTCDSVDLHYSILTGFRWASGSSSETEKEMFLRCKALRLHGKMNQEDRKATFLTFKTEKSALLLSTDVCARGLDFPKVRCIIQYDPPGEASDYVHRVGRTARLDHKGDSLLFLQPVETEYLKDLEKHGLVLTEYPILKLLNSFGFHSQGHQTDIFISHPWLLALQRALESFISTVPSMNKLARAAFCSWVRAYTAHRGELKRIFMVKKLHLGHVAKSFALKQQPSQVNKSVQKEIKKRKRKDSVRGKSKKRAVISVS